MTLERPTVEHPAPGVLIARYEWPEHLSAEWQGELLARARAAAQERPVSLVFVLADRIREIPPTVRVFWRTVTSDPGLRIRSLAVVTTSWAVEVEARGFGVTTAMVGAPVLVQTFAEERQALDWVAATSPARFPVMRLA